MARPIIPLFRDDTVMTLGALCAECGTYLLNVRGFSPTTVDGYRRTYDQFRAHLRAHGRPDAVKEFTGPMVFGFVNDVAQRGGKPNTILVKLGALSTLAQYAMKRPDERTGKPLLTDNPTKTFDWPQFQQPETYFLYPDELRAFLAVELPRNEAAARDLLVDTALRVSELCRANVGDLLETPDGWVLAVTVKGRGRRQRKLHAPVSLPVVDGLRDFLLARGHVRPDDPLLVNQQGRRYTRNALQYVVVRTAKQAGIDRFRVSPHKVRHTTNVIRKVGGSDRFTRSRLLGQSDPRSQDRYDHLVPGDLQAAKAQQTAGLGAYLKLAKDGGAGQS